MYNLVPRAIRAVMVEGTARMALGTRLTYLIRIIRVKKKRYSRSFSVAMVPGSQIMEARERERAKKIERRLGGAAQSPLDFLCSLAESLEQAKFRFT